MADPYELTPEQMREIKAAHVQVQLIDQQFIEVVKLSGILALAWATTLAELVEMDRSLAIAYLRFGQALGGEYMRPEPSIVVKRVHGLAQRLLKLFTTVAEDDESGDPTGLMYAIKQVLESTPEKEWTPTLLVLSRLCFERFLNTPTLDMADMQHAHGAARQLLHEAHQRARVRSQSSTVLPVQVPTFEDVQLLTAEMERAIETSPTPTVKRDWMRVRKLVRQALGVRVQGNQNSSKSVSDESDDEMLL